MYDEKETNKKIDKVNDKVHSIETKVVQIDEKTKKLDKLDTIEATLHDLRANIPPTGEIASKNYVDKSVHKSKNTIITYVIGTGIGLTGAVAGLLRLFLV